MSNFFSRQAARFNNEMAQSCGALIGIVQGLLADRHLNDQEIRFLDAWLTSNASCSTSWPGNIVHERLQAVLADGLVSETERDGLVELLLSLTGGALDSVASAPIVNRLAIDETATVHFPQRRFVLTGDFAYGQRKQCQELTVSRGGEIAAAVSGKVHYVVVGGLGSSEWKHGSFGTKIEKAIELRNAGLPILIVHEDAWVAAIRDGAPNHSSSSSSAS